MGFAAIRYSRKASPAIWNRPCVSVDADTLIGVNRDTVWRGCACGRLGLTENAWTLARTTGSCRSLTTTPTMMPGPVFGVRSTLWLIPPELEIAPVSPKIIITADADGRSAIASFRQAPL